MNRITHFELASSDLPKTIAFYREVFGWKINKWDGPVDYWLVDTGNGDPTGINGGLMETDGQFRGTINTVEVADIDAAIEKVKAHGGEIVLPKDVIPGIGYQAYFKDNTGILMGIHQSDPTARK
ncbi:MAG: VOC family protein [Anaerolineaceae bacterium]|jgi:predicted enzyme related to lactoylglutathione lyase